MTLEDARIVLSTLGNVETPRLSAFKLRLQQAIEDILKASKEPGTGLDNQILLLTSWLLTVGQDVETPEVGTDLLAASLLLRAARDRAVLDEPLYRKKTAEMHQMAARSGQTLPPAPDFDPDQFGSSKGMRMSGKARLQEVGFQFECAIRLADWKAAPPRLTILRSEPV